MASKTKYIKFNIKTCFFLTRKRNSVSYVWFRNELQNVYYERSTFKNPAISIKKKGVEVTSNKSS